MNYEYVMEWQVYNGEWDEMVSIEAPIEKSVSGFHDVYFVIERSEKPNKEFMNFLWKVTVAPTILQKWS